MKNRTHKRTFQHLISRTTILCIEAILCGNIKEKNISF